MPSSARRRFAGALAVAVLSAVAPSQADVSLVAEAPRAAGISRPAADSAASFRAGGTVGDLLRAIDGRLTNPHLSGLTRIGGTGLPLDGAPAPDGHPQEPGYYYSDVLNPGDADGNGKDDLLFWGLNHEFDGVIRLTNGSDGTELWTLREPIDRWTVVYFEVGSFDDRPGTDVVLLRVEYRRGEWDDNLVAPSRRDEVLQRLTVRNGTDGSVSWEREQTASVVTRDEVTPQSLPWFDTVVETTDLIMSVQLLRNVAGRAGEDLFVATVDLRETERYRALGFLASEHFASGRARASLLEGEDGVAAHVVERASEVGIPSAFPVGDVSGEGSFDFAFALPAAAAAVAIEAWSLDGRPHWAGAVPGDAATVYGVPLLGGDANDLMVVAETVVDAEEGTREYATYARGGRDGSPLWDTQRALLPLRLGDVDGNDSQELLITDSDDPRDARSIHAASGATLRRVWGPVRLDQYRGKSVETICWCSLTADFDADAIPDVYVHREIGTDWAWEGQMLALGGRDGKRLWTHSSIDNPARPVSGRSDLNGNGTTDVYSNGIDEMTFLDGRGLSPLWEIATGDALGGTLPLGADLVGTGGIEMIMHHDYTSEARIPVSRAYDRDVLLWEARHEP